MALAQHSPMLLPLALDDNALASLPEENEEEAPDQTCKQTTDAQDSSAKQLSSLMSYLQLPTGARTRSNSSSSNSESAESTDYSRRNSQDLLQDLLDGELSGLSSLDDDEDLVNLCGFHNTNRSLERRKQKTPSFNSERRRQVYTKAARSVKLRRPPNYA